MNAALDGLKPADEAGRRALAEAERLYAASATARLTDGAAARRPHILAAGPGDTGLVMPLFCGLGALSRANATTVAALALGSAAVASAIWLGLALSQPLAGTFRLSPAPIQQALMEIAQ